MTFKGPRKGNGNGFEGAVPPSHLLRRVYQYHGDLFQRETGARNLTKQQFLLLSALEQNDGASQTELVEDTGIDRSTLAEMIKRLRDRSLVMRERTEDDQRANAVNITLAGRKAVRAARAAADKADKGLLDPVPAAERQRFLRHLGMIAAAAESDGNGSGGGRRKPRKRT